MKTVKMSRTIRMAHPKDPRHPQILAIEGVEYELVDAMADEAVRQGWAEAVDQAEEEAPEVDPDAQDEDQDEDQDEAEKDQADQAEKPEGRRTRRRRAQ